MTEERRGSGTTLVVVLAILGAGGLAALIWLAPIFACSCKELEELQISVDGSVFVCSMCRGRGRLTIWQKFDLWRTGGPRFYLPEK